MPNPPRNGEGDRRPQAGGGGAAPVTAALAETVGHARRLRRNLTLPEVLLWTELRRRPASLKFRRQHPVGRYVLDFYCVRARLAVEIDGEAHGRGDRPERDAARDRWLARQGIAVLRLPAQTVLHDLAGAVEAVVAAAASARPLHHAPHGPPPRAGEEQGKPS